MQHEGMEYVLTNGNVIAEKALRDRLLTPNVQMESQRDDYENIIETLHKVKDHLITTIECIKPKRCALCTEKIKIHKAFSKGQK